MAVHMRDPATIVHLYNIPSSTSENELQAALRTVYVGAMLVSIKPDKDGSSKGEATLFFRTYEEAEVAFWVLNGAEMSGHQLAATWSEDPRPAHRRCEVRALVESLARKGER